MKKGLTEYVFVVDCSESMTECKAKTMETFNTMVENYKNECDDGIITTIMFNERSKIFHDRIDINDAKPLSEENYTPSGKTALIDALGLTIKHIATIQKYARDEDKPEHTVFVVMTDGKEDASKRYSADEVEKFVTIRKEIFGWEFIFTNAGFDTIITACKVGQTADADTDTEGGYDIDIDDLLKIFENKKS
ncbi:MAG: VWA domain-containing protein [Oscillospiraceae bacterium]|nr:VWA domain-containing protein [Oscillospiraceae bacterium]